MSRNLLSDLRDITIYFIHFENSAYNNIFLTINSCIHKNPSHSPDFQLKLSPQFPEPRIHIQTTIFKNQKAKKNNSPHAPGPRCS